MALLRVWYRAIILTSILRGTSLSSNSPSQDLIFGLVGQQWSSRARAGVEEALYDINNRSDILSDYKLKYFVHTPTTGVESQSECSREAALVELVGQMFNCSHQIVALIGLGCSVSTEAIAKISQHYNIIQLSCTSTLHEDDDTELEYPYYFQLLPSEVNLARVFYSIIKEYGWRRVALIVQNEHRYRAMASSLKFMLSNNAIDYTEKVLGEELSGVMVSDARIFVLATDSRLARKLICEAHKLEMRYPKHLFLTYGTYESKWWAVEDNRSYVEEEFKCSAEDRAIVLESSLAALHFEIPSSRTVVEQRVHPLAGSASPYDFYYQCYDAVLALAMSLNKTIEELNANESLKKAAKEQAELKRDQDFQITNLINYNINNIVAELLKKHLSDTNFAGTSGPVRFDGNGIRDISELKVLQYRITNFSHEELYSSFIMWELKRKLRLIEVATVRNNSLVFLVGNKDNIWPGYTPIDGVPKIGIASISLAVTATFILLHICGVVFALFCLSFNIINRKKRVIRLSSPNLNNIIIGGAILTYCSGIASALPIINPQTRLFSCFVPNWLLLFGYTCSIGTITVKQWRVHCIFKNPYKKKSGIQDWYLILVVAALLLSNVAFLCLHILLEGVINKFTVTTVPNKERPFRLEGMLAVQTDLYIYTCSSHRWIGLSVLGLVYGFVGILQTAALYFAFQINKVKVKGLNDSKYTAALIYTITILVIILAVTSFVFNVENYLNTSTSIDGILIWMAGTLILGLMFIPKMVSLYKDPEGVTVFAAHDVIARTPVTLATVPITQPQIPSWASQEADSLRKRVKTLEKAIVEYKKVTGLDLTLSEQQLTSSVSMICIRDQSSQKELQKLEDVCL